MSASILERPSEQESSEVPVMPAAAVIIPHFNDVVRLERCLDALAAAARPQPVEILVVDNASTESLVSIISKHPDVRFVTEARRGAATARNRGVEESTSPRIFFLDADCIPAQDWLEHAFAVIETKQIVGGAIRVFDETPPPRSGAQAFEAVFAFQQKDYVEKEGFSVTANLLTWRAVVEDTGPLINGLSEDKDWCLRAAAKGYEIAYAPELVVYHPSRSDWRALRKKWFRLTVESYGQARSGNRSRWSWLARSLVVFLSPFAHLPKVLRAPQLASSGERLRGALTLFRLRFVRSGWMVRQALGRPLDGM